MAKQEGEDDVEEGRAEIMKYLRERIIIMN